MTEEINLNDRVVVKLFKDKKFKGRVVELQGVQKVINTDDGLTMYVGNDSLLKRLRKKKCI